LPRIINKLDESTRLEFIRLLDEQMPKQKSAAGKKLKVKGAKPAKKVRPAKPATTKGSKDVGIIEHCLSDSYDIYNSMFVCLLVLMFVCL
jgi:hypothetical protein